MPSPTQSASPKPADAGKKLAWVASSNFGEGLPWAFMHQMGTEYLTAIRVPLEQVGYTSWLHLITTLKFLWSPLVDLFGKKRSWLWLMQLGVGAGMLGIAQLTATAPQNLRAFWLGMVVLSLLVAVHDIACDGFYLLGLKPREQALFSGARIAAFRVAMLVGSGALVVVAGHWSWRLGFGAAGLLMFAIGLLNAKILPRIDEPKLLHQGTKLGVWLEAYKTFFQQPQAARVLAFIFFHKLGDIMMFAMAKPLLRDIGVDTAHRGLLSGTGICVFIGSTILGGALIARQGLQRCLVPMTFFQNLAIPLYFLLAVFSPPFWVIVIVVVIEQLAAGIGESAKAVFLLQRCRSAFSASHFAFTTAIVALGSTVAGAFSGHLAARLGMPAYFALCFVASWPSLVLVFLVPRAPLDAT